MLTKKRVVLVDGLPVTREAGPVILRPLSIITIGPVAMHLLLPRAFADHSRCLLRLRRGSRAALSALGAFPTTEQMSQALALFTEWEKKEKTGEATHHQVADQLWKDLRRLTTAAIRGEAESKATGKRRRGSH